MDNSDSNFEQLIGKLNRDMEIRKMVADSGPLEGEDVDDPWPARDGSQGNWSSSFATDLNAVQPDAYKYPIAMEYQHTYIDTAYNICGSLDVSFSLGSGSITMNGDTQGWTDAAQNSI